MMTEGSEEDKQRAEMFDALGHSARIKILRALNKGPLGFAELKKYIDTESSGHLTHHLEKLGDLIKKDEYGKYCISDKGKAALLTLRPIEKYNEDARFREQAGLLIRALRSDTDGVREIAVAQLSLFGPKVVPLLRLALKEAIKDQEEAENRGHYEYGSSPREAAERAVGCLTTIFGIISVPGTVPDIAQVLPRAEAFKALAKIGNKEALDAIIMKLPAWYSKQNYKRYDWRYDWESKVEAEIDTFMRETLNGFEEEGRIALESALTAEGFEGKNVIARALAVVGDDESVPALTSALEGGDFLTKTEAAITLTRLKAVEVVPKIINQLFKIEDALLTEREKKGYSSQDDHDARKACEIFDETILKLGSTEDWISVAFHSPRLEENLLKSFDEAIINSKEKAVPTLTKLLEAPDANVQRKAAEMIVEIKKGGNRDDNYRSRI
jgi:DNA-binding HxlR family transcriptional regulator